ncbi:AAA family ATPase [Streptomyces sp. NPDC048629]|uniref:AAA family ATPase n=1 Tax=Streptomyces sp. NPDC048629 TaxID=3154824 RepID=UPI0034372B03
MGTPECGRGAPHGLVGRDEETLALRRLLARHRVVTVAGPVGVGKSRLAATVRAGLARVPGRCVVLVRWPGTRPGAPGALTAAVVEAAAGGRQRRAGSGMGETRTRETRTGETRTGSGPDGPRAAGACADAAVRRRVEAIGPAFHGLAAVRGLAERWRDADVLLLLDDIDPVHAECVGLVQSLLEHVPTLRVLVTARKPLGLGGEGVLRLASLGAEPSPGRCLPPAVELFLERARDAGVDADGLDPVDLRAVTDVCRALGGLPLAIELAAAQLDRHGAAGLAHRVAEHQLWLNAPHAAVPRHRSLRDAVAAAYVLCDREERIVWGRAGILAGPFDESTAVFVCTGGGLDESTVPACLARLAAVGVLTFERDPGGTREPRYRMAPAARDFGRERLAAARESEVAAERRAIHVQRTAAVAENLWSTGCQAQAVRLVQTTRPTVSRTTTGSHRAAAT